MNNTMGYVLTALLLCLIVFRRLSLNLTRQQIAWYQDPVILLSGAWMIQALIFSLPIFINRDPFEARHVAYIFACHVCFFIGVLAANGIKPSRDAGPATQSWLTMKVVLIVGFLGMMGNIFVLYDGLSISNVDFFDRISGAAAAEIRLERFMNSAMFRSGPFVRFESLAAATTIYIALLAAGVTRSLNPSRKMNRIATWMAAISLILVIFNSLYILGGRIGVFLLVLGAFFAALMDPHKWLFRTIHRSLGVMRGFVYILLMAGSLFTVWHFSTAFMKERGGESRSPLITLAQYHRATLSEGMMDLVGSSENLQYATLTLSYVTVPLSTLAYYYDQGEGRFAGPYWGQYNFGSPVTFIMRRMGLVKHQKTMNEIRQEATNELVSMGYGDNVWSTILRDFALDVGWAGVPVVMLVFGFIAELVIRRTREASCDFITRVIGLLMCVLIVFSIGHSLLIVNSIQTALWFCLGILLLQALHRKFSGTATSVAVTPGQAS